MTIAPERDLARGLRVLAADEDEAALCGTADLLAGLGHEVTSLAVGHGLLPPSRPGADGA